MKKLFCLTLALLFALSAVSALAYDAYEYNGTMYVVNCRNWVTLRALPSTSSASLDRIPLHAEVWVEPYSSMFAHVKYRGRWGYVLTEYLDYNAEGAGGYMWVINCRDWVSLRTSPSTSAPRIAKVPLNAKVYVYDQVGGFCHCEYNGMDGWILASYLGY